jgi:hypothetical protein
VGRRKIRVHLFSETLHFDLIVVDVRSTSSICVRTISRSVCARYDQGVTYNLGSLIGGIGSGKSKNHLYSGLTQLELGLGRLSLVVGVAFVEGAISDTVPLSRPKAREELSMRPVVSHDETRRHFIA